LRRLRHEKGLSEDAVAGHVGLSPQAVRSHEQARTQPAFDTLAKYADLYGTTIDYIVKGKAAEVLLFWHHLQPDERPRALDVLRAAFGPRGSSG
jgi:transcriptional regulator with XRE-family HTH domain